MPIKAENKNRYPPNWKEIVARIKERDGNKCAFCKVPNYELIFRGMSGDVAVYQNMDGFIYNAENGEYMGGDYIGDLDGRVTTAKVILTCMHLDHTPENCEDDNLKMGCQRCHLNFDREHHKEQRRVTHTKKTKEKKQPQLF